MPQCSTQSPYLVSLPAELLERVISHVAQSSPSSIQALLRTCKQIHNFVLPYSVETFRVPTTGDHGTTAMVTFLRYITITKPHLAPMVKSITAGHFDTADDHDNEEDGEEDGGDGVDGYDEVDGTENDDGGQNINSHSRAFKGLSEDEIAIYKGIIDDCITEAESEHWKTWRAVWLEDMERGFGDAFVALLLAVCTNLVEFNFGEPYNPRCMLQLVQAAASRSRNLESKNKTGLPRQSAKVKASLQNLQDVFHESDEGKYGYLMFATYSSPFLQLPAIRTWECVMANGDDGSAENFNKLGRGSSPVQHILIRKSCITAAVLNSIVGVCHSLRSFEYSRGLYHMYELEMMPRDLLLALLPHASTLYSLYVNYEDDWQKVGWEDYPNSLYMGVELKQMIALRELTAGMQTLTGLLDGQPSQLFTDELPLQVDGAPRLVECLPPQLEYLEIHGCGKAILEQAQELIDAAAAPDGDFSKLSRIKLLFNAEKTRPDEVDLHSMRDTLSVELIFQQPEHRKYDMCPTYEFPGSTQWVHNICTKIGDPTMRCRDLWLNTRGSDKGEADENGVVTSIIV